MTLPNINDVKKRDGMRDFRKCQAHNMWMRKGQCELCRMAQDKQLLEQEKLTGSNKPEIKVGKI
jgi:hypothetical protein